MSVLCIVVAIAYCEVHIALCILYGAYCFAVHIVHFPIQILTLLPLVASDFNSERHNDMDRARAPK